MNYLTFLKTALKDYRVGAITPTSAHVIERLSQEWKPEHRYYVEYGPGDGVITKALLAALPPDGRVVAIERNERFLPELNAINDPRLTVIHGDVVGLSGLPGRYGLPRIDAVISGIPFSFLSSAQRKEVVANTYHALAKGGVFMLYQTSPLMAPYLRTRFPSVTMRLEVRNIPPYFLMNAEKA